MDKIAAMKVGVIQFPGSNCDMDAVHAFAGAMQTPAERIWHKDTSLESYDALIVPGGFSYGDYLRCGAIARFSPVMKEVVAFAERGGPVMGICNGFQILCEIGLLPGALIRNNCLEFRCLTADLSVADAGGTFDRKHLGEHLRLPIAHGEGNYRIDKDGLRRLREENHILFRYASPTGNPNGSLDDIAGIRNQQGNVFGMMPHPERAVDPIHPTRDGLLILRAFLETAATPA